MGTSGNNANIFYLKTGFPFFGACDGNLWKIISISSIWKRDFPFLGLWWEPLENNINYLLFENGISVFFLGLWWEPHLKTGFPCLLGLFWNIFYLKTGFPFFWACDGNLWKIISISSIWKRDFPFLGLWWEPLENNANIFYLKTEFPCFFWACDGNLIWKRDFRVFLGFSGISSIWKRDFPFFGLVMGTSGK